MKGNITVCSNIRLLNLCFLINLIKVLLDPGPRLCCIRIIYPCMKKNLHQHNIVNSYLKCGGSVHMENVRSCLNRNKWTNQGFYQKVCNSPLSKSNLMLYNKNTRNLSLCIIWFKKGKKKPFSKWVLFVHTLYNDAQKHSPIWRQHLQDDIISFM